MALRWRFTSLALVAAGLLACSPRFEWREVRVDDRATVSLPGRPQSVTRDLVIDGQRVSMTMWSTGVGPTMFAVGAAQLPPALLADPASRDRALAYFRDGLVRNIGGTVVAQKPAPLTLPAGSPRKLLASQSVEAVGTSGPDARKSKLAARFFIVDDQLFQVVALGAEGELPPEVLDTFFTSFRPAP
jgi:hypothetical protein